METQRTILIVLLPFLINIAISASAICYNNKTGVYECCQDYTNISGKCEACIGSWGKNCDINCSYGYYGHGCRTKCNCGHQQKCDPKQGCIVSTPEISSPTIIDDSNMITVYLLAVSGLLILLLFGVVLICHRKVREQTKSSKRCSVTNYEDKEEQEDPIYNDVSESRMVGNGVAISSDIYDLPPHFCGVTYSTKNQPNQSKAPLTRSRTVGLEEYGHWYRGSDDYNHINFNSVKQLSSYSTVMTNDYDIFKPSSTSLENP